MVGGFGEYVVYVDEAGDHGRVSPEFPVFVLAFCIFKKQDYASTVLPAVHGLKFRYFGHDAVVLHEREIRKAAAPFEFLRVPDTRTSFMDELSRIIEAAPFSLIAVVVDKRQLAPTQPATNAYALALDAGLVHVTRYLRSNDETRLTHVVVESRGAKEDQELIAAFNAYCSPSGSLDGCNLDLVFASKAQNHGGMQLADMVARPIGRQRIDTHGKLNRAYEILRAKFWSSEHQGLLLLPEADRANRSVA